LDAHHAARRGLGENESSSAQAVPSPVEREPLPEVGASGNPSVSHIPFQVLSWEPRAYFYPGFLDEERCKRIIEIAARRLAPSSLALRAGDTLEGTADVRTSQGTFVTRRDDPDGALEYLEKRIAEATFMPPHHGEPFNVLRYEIGQKYDSHHDTFDPESYGPQQSQRVASMLIYLNEWEEGGETGAFLRNCACCARADSLRLSSSVPAGGEGRPGEAGQHKLQGVRHGAAGEADEDGRRAALLEHLPERDVRQGASMLRNAALGADASQSL